jgi:hypothetical protein
MPITGGPKINIISEFWDKGLKQAESGFKSLGQKALDFGKNVVKAGAVAAAAMAAYAVKLGVDGVKAAIKAEAAQNRLATILTTTGGATQKQIGLLNEQAKALEKVGVVSADNVKVVQSQLATFDLSYKTLRNLTPAILDYVTAEKGATATTEDFKSMTNGLAQALQGNFASLTRTGFVLDETTKNMIANGTETERTAALVKVLNSTYEGFNETLTETTEGKLQKLNNAFGQLQEQIGVALLPYVLKFADAFTNHILPVLEKVSDFIINKVIPAIEDMANWLVKELSPAWQWLTNYFNKHVLPVLEMLWNAFTKYVVPALIETYNYVKDKLATAFKNMKTFVRENKDELMALAKFIAVVLYGVFKAILWIIERVADGFTGFTEGLVRAGRAAKQIAPYMKDVYDKIKLLFTALSYVNPLFKGVVAGLNQIEKGIQNFNNIDWSFGGEKAATDWLKGWGVGWSSNTTTDVPEVKDFFKNLGTAVSTGTAAAIDGGTSKLKERMDKFKDTLKSKLEEAKDAFKTFRDEVQQTIMDAIDFGAAFQKVEDAKKEAAENGTEFGGTFIDALIEQANKATEFAQKIQTLVEMGLSKDAISEVLAAGTEAGTAIADELIAGGSDAINKTNQLVDSTKQAAKKVGKFAADSYYGAGVDTAKKMVEGFKDLVKEGGKGFKELMAAMDKLAKKLARTVKIKIEASSGGTSVEIPALAKGGIVRKPTLALIGEAGPEAVVPLKPRGPSYGIDPVGRGITINVTGALDPESVARQIETILKRSQLRAGAY